MGIFGLLSGLFLWISVLMEAQFGLESTFL